MRYVFTGRSDFKEEGRGAYSRKAGGEQARRDDEMSRELDDCVRLLMAY